MVDGITEIAEPAGAVLRDHVQDLHAIRSTSVKSVMRTGGQGAIELAENVKLHAGTGNAVPFPEVITVVFAPFAGIPDIITLSVTVKPTIARDSEKVSFSLRCPGLDDALAQVLSNLAGNVEESTGLAPHWVP